MNIIECSHLTHSYNKRLIYDDLSFSVPEGRILGLLGKNGTGKTTTINIMTGFLKPQKGTVKIFGQDTAAMADDVRARIGLLIEGHVQYSYMNISQIEKFYSAFYPKWNAKVFYELMKKLKVAPSQKISSMSNGQRSQVALGLILAQSPDLLVLDDFSLGLDPGYRRLFSEYLRDYAKTFNKTVFLTSHIIQDLERLIDDCIILDYGKILIQMPLKELNERFRIYRLRNFSGNMEALSHNKELYHPDAMRDYVEFGSFLPPEHVKSILATASISYSDLSSSAPSLEDSFISLTGKY